MKIYDVRGIGASLTGSFSGSFKGLFTGPLDGVAATSSYVEYTNVANKPALVSGSSQVSFTGITNKPTLVSGSSQVTYSGLSGIPNGIVSGSSQVLGFNVFATTGSNGFNGNQSITGSLTVTGQVVAQTLNVQQVTSSIVFSSGSNRFGNSLANTQQFTGSVLITGSIGVNRTPEFTLDVNGDIAFNRTNKLQFTGGIVGDRARSYLTGDGNNNIFVYGPSSNLIATFGYTGNVGIGATGLSEKLTVDGNILLGGDYNLAIDITTNGSGKVGRTDRAYLQINRSNFEGFLSFHTTSTGAGGLSERLRITSTGNVGIGTTSPNAQLNVGHENHGIGFAYLGSSTLPALAGIFTSDGTAGGQTAYGSLLIKARSDFGGFYSINFFTAASDNTSLERMRITSGGNVGIGTISPSTRLDIANGTLTLPTLRGRTYELSNVSSANPNLINGTGFNSIPVRVGDIIDLPFSQTRTVTAVTDTQITVNAAWTVSFAGSNVEGRGGIVFEANNAERMRITSGGNVAIGTTIASNVGLTIFGSNAATIYQTSNTGTGAGNGFYVGHTGDISYVWNYNNYPTVFATNNTERMRITSGGNVGIGTTSPSSLLDVRGRQFVGGGTSTYVPTSGTSIIARETADTFLGVHSAGYGAMVIGWDQSEDRATIAVDSSQDIVFITDMATVDGADNLSGKTPKLTIKGNGTIQPGANGTQDLGTSSLRWATVFTSDLSLSNGIGDYTIVEGEHDLFLYNNKNNKVYKFLVEEVDPSTATPKKS